MGEIALRLVPSLVDTNGHLHGKNEYYQRFEKKRPWLFEFCASGGEESGFGYGSENDTENTIGVKDRVT